MRISRGLAITEISDYPGAYYINALKAHKVAVIMVAFRNTLYPRDLVLLQAAGNVVSDERPCQMDNIT